MTYTRKAFYGFLWVTVAAIFANVFGYLLRLLLARSLTVAEYGLIYSIMALFGLVSLFQHLGLGEAIAKYTSSFTARNDDRSIKEVLIWSSIMLYCSTFLIAIVAWVLAKWLGDAYFQTPIASTLVIIYAVAILLSPIGIIIPSFFQGRQRMDLQSLYVVVQSGTLLLSTWFLLNAGYGIKGAMIAYVLLYAVMYAVFLPIVFIVIPGLARIKMRIVSATPRLLLKYSIPVMLTSVAGIILSFTDTAMLTFFSSLEEVGVYQAALPTANILLFLTSVIATVLLPLVAELWEKKEESLLAVAIADLYLYVLILVLPMVLVALIFPDIILNLLFGASYIGGARILQFLAISAFFLTMNAINTSALSGIGLPAETTKAVMIGAGVNFVVNLFLIPRYGGVGAGISTAVSSVIIFSLTWILLRRTISFQVDGLGVMKILLAGVLLWVSLLIARSFPLEMYPKMFIAMLLGAFIYLGALFVFDVVTIQRLRVLKKRIWK